VGEKLPGTLKTRAIILSAIRWKESSKIITVYTEDSGRVKLIARGALRNNSVFAGKIESLFLVDLIIEEKKSRTLNLLKEADVINTFSKIRLDFKIYPFALTIMEILNQVIDEAQPDPVFFGFILEMLKAFPEIKNPEIVLIYFLLKLTSYMGFKPSLGICNSGNLSMCDQKVYLSMSEGNVSCRNCNKSAVNIIPFSRNQFTFLQKLQKINYKNISQSVEDRSDFLIIVHSLVKYINFHFEKDVKINSLNLLGKHY